MKKKKSVEKVEKSKRVTIDSLIADLKAIKRKKGNLPVYFNHQSSDPRVDEDVAFGLIDPPVTTMCFSIYGDEDEFPIVLLSTTEPSDKFIEEEGDDDGEDETDAALRERLISLLDRLEGKKGK